MPDLLLHTPSRPVLFAFALVLAVGGATAARAASIIVNTAADSAGEDGACSLREALLAASTGQPSGASAGECVAGSPSGVDSILFAIPGAGPHAIQLLSHLPALSPDLVIDGFSQPGATPNTRSALDQFDAVYRIRIQGRVNPNPPLQPGLLGVGVRNVRIRGLEFTGFAQLPGQGAEFPIAFFESQQVVVEGNWLHHNTAIAVWMQDCAGVQFGGVAAGERNLIHDQTGSGVSAWYGLGSRNARIEGNVIGVRFVNGLPQPGPIGGSGIYGPALADSEIRGNWVASGNRGIQLQNAGSQGVLVEANRIGGVAGFGNDFGILIASGVGNGAPVGHQIQYNEISYNDVGVQVQNSGAGLALRAIKVSGNRIRANLGMEIDLGPDGGNFGDGPTPNDPGDLDLGPNARQNYPVIGQIAWSVAEGLWTMGYTLDSPPGSYEIEVQFGSRCDGTGFGVDGDVPPTSTQVAVQNPGSNFTASYPDGIPASGFVSALATGADGTSEFSPCARYVAPTDLFGDGFE